MSYKLNIVALVFAILLLYIVLYIVRKGRISIKYSFVWLFSSLFLIAAALIPSLVKYLSDLFGFQTVSNMVFSLLFAVLIFITLSLTIIVSGQNEKIRLLIQEISILKQEQNKK